jgi:hypothetical protein
MASSSAMAPAPNYFNTSAFVTRNIAHQQIRSVPVENHDSHLVGVLSLGVLAPRCCQSGEQTVGGHGQDRRRA